MKPCSKIICPATMQKITRAVRGALRSSGGVRPRRGERAKWFCISYPLPTLDALGIDVQGI